MTNRKSKIAEAQKQIEGLDRKIQNLKATKQVLEAKLEIWMKQEANGEKDFRPRKVKPKKDKDSSSSIPSPVPSQINSSTSTEVIFEKIEEPVRQTSTVHQSLQAATF